MAKTRKVHRKRKQKRSRRQRGGGQVCSDNENMWICSSGCGKDSKCETFD